MYSTILHQGSSLWHKKKRTTILSTLRLKTFTFGPQVVSNNNNKITATIHDMCVHPRKLMWNLKNSPLKRNIIFQTFTLGFHVNFRGRMFFLEGDPILDQDVSLIFNKSNTNFEAFGPGNICPRYIYSSCTYYCHMDGSLQT